MQRDGWTFPLLFREAARNVFGRGSKMLIIFLVAVAFGLGLVLFQALETHVFLASLAERASDGRNVVVFASVDGNTPARISRASCEKLAGVPGVERAGLIRLDDRVTMPQLGTNIQQVTASASLFPELRRYDALVGSSLRTSNHEFGLRLAAGSSAQAMVLTKQPSGLDVNSSVITGFDQGISSGDTCVAVLNQFQESTILIPILTTQLAASDTPIIGFSGYKETLSPITLFLERPERFLPLLAGAVGALACGIQNRYRSRDLAAYRLSGSSPATVAILLWSEQVLISGGMISSGSIATLLLQDHLVSPNAALGWILAGACLWLSGACLLSLGVVAKNPTALLRDQ